MRTYVLRRVAQSALTLLGVSVLVFVILRVLPGDPARMLLPDGAPESAVAELNRQLGLKEPIVVQYGLFLKAVARGDFGQSFQYGAPARDDPSRAGRDAAHDRRRRVARHPRGGAPRDALRRGRDAPRGPRSIA